VEQRSRGVVPVCKQTSPNSQLIPPSICQLIWAGRDYPAGLDKLRSGAKRAFFAKKDEKDPEKISQALRHVLEHSRHTLLGVTPTFRLSQGEFVLQELEALVKLHKYRSLQKQYNPNQDEVLASEFERFKKRAE